MLGHVRTTLLNPRQEQIFFDLLCIPFLDGSSFMFVGFVKVHFFVCVFCFSLRMCYICVELWKGSRVSRRAVKSRQMVAVVLPLGNVDKRCQSVVAFRLQVLTH